MDLEDLHWGAHPGDPTTLSISASPEMMNTSLSPHRTAGLQPTIVLQTTIGLQQITDTRMSSGTPEADADNDSSETMLEDNRMSTPASEVCYDDDADLDPSDETQEAANITEEPISYKRALRPTRGTAPSTWIDADTTGDFDPLEEARKARPRRKKAKLSHRGKSDSADEEHTHEPAIESEPEPPPPPPLCIRFGSSAGKLAFSELCAKLDREVKPSHDNWTAGYQLRKRKSPSEGLFSGALTVQSTGVRVIASEQLCDFTNHPVARGCFDCLALGVRCSLLDDEHSWPCDDCKDNDNDCHLVKEPELKLACTHCQYLGKKKKWLVCSFDSDPDPSGHRGRCSECKETGHRPCIAGPDPIHVRTRIRIGPDGEPYTNEPSNGRKAPRKATCLQCLEGRRACSLNTGTLHGDEGSCTACDMAGEACEPLGSRVPQHRRHQQSPRDSVQKGSKESDVEQDHAEIVSTTSDPGPIFARVLTTAPELLEDSVDPEQGDAKPWISVPATPVNEQTSTLLDLEQGDAKIYVVDSGPTTPVNHDFASRAPETSPPRSDSPLPVSGTPRTVSTKLRHPVHFDYKDPTRDGSDPCHFCHRAAYSIIGLEERTLEIIEWDDGSGWEEVRGGHKSEGQDPTQVCPECTMARMKIMVCGDHALRRIEGVDNEKQDLLKATNRLVDWEDEERRAVDKEPMETWCSVCCNLATWECCLEQEYEHGEGCGLALCELCVVDLGRFGGSFEEMLQELKDELTTERPLGLRADYGLLKQDGLLMGYLQYSAPE